MICVEELARCFSLFPGHVFPGRGKKRAVQEDLHGHVIKFLLFIITIQKIKGNSISMTSNKITFWTNVPKSCQVSKEAAANPMGPRQLLLDT